MIEGEIERRKAEHMQIAAAGDVEARTGPGWLDIHLIHQALPTANLAAIDLGVEFLGGRLAAPLVIAGMTGGHPAASEVNAILARSAARHGLAMGVGSQRAALANPKLSPTYKVAREVAPDAFLIANLGAAQLVLQDGPAVIGPDQLRAAVAMIEADALAIHLNFLEEAVQLEGDRNVVGLRQAIADAVAAVEVPVIAKETGAGMSRAAAIDLAGLGVRALDIGGLGGTSFAAVEARRAEARGEQAKASLGAVYRDWGIPTAVSIVAATAAGLPLIATGGVRSGLDAAKAIALGASLVGVARPILAAALEGEASVEEWIARFLEELRLAIFLTGGSRLEDLGSAHKVILGETRRWLDELGWET